MSKDYIVLCIRYIDPVINDEIEIRELVSHGSRSFNNSLIIFPHISHVFSHVGDTLVSSDWFIDQSLARDYRYRHVLFYGSTCWLVDWKIFVQSDLHLKTLSSVYGIRWIFLSTVLWLVHASSDFCLKRWCALFRYASYWLNCLSLHDYGVQLYHEDLGDESLSFLFNFSAGWLDRSGGATIIDEDHGPWVVLPPLVSCFLFGVNEFESYS